MNKKNIITILTKGNNTVSLVEEINVKTENYNREKIIAAIKESLNEMENARRFFETVSDPKLIDYAIYMEAAAQARYTYLINQAREMGVTMDISSILKEARIV